MSNNELPDDHASTVSSQHSLNSRVSRTRRQGTYWMGTISTESEWEPSLPEGVAYLRGQLERGDGGFEHHQIFFILQRKGSLRAVRRLWDPIIGHWELTRSRAAEQYVWKDDTRIGEPYEFGSRPLNRNDATDWDAIRNLASTGQFEAIPSDVFIRYYGNLNRIRNDFVQPIAMVRSCSVLWGPTGSGKSRRAWLEAGDEAYAKDPRTKFW